jgi:hypothetical protein
MLLINQPLFCVCVKFYTIVNSFINYSVTNSMGFWRIYFFDKTFLENSIFFYFHISMHGPSWSPKLYEDLFFSHILLIVKFAYCHISMHGPSWSPKLYEDVVFFFGSYFVNSQTWLNPFIMDYHHLHYINFFSFHIYLIA